MEKLNQKPFLSEQDVLNKIVELEQQIREAS
jgi:hypothetical protein